MGTDPDASQAAQRARLLEGLAASIREKGLAQTQVTDVVRHAKASRRTFYKHFPDKDSAFVALTMEMSNMLQEQVERAIDPDAPVVEQVDAAIEAYVSALMSDPALTLTFVSPALGERIVIAQREGFERYAQLAVRATEEAAARDPNVTPLSLERAYMAIAGMHECIMRALAHGDDLTAVTGELKAFMRVLVDAQLAGAASAR